MKSIEELQEKLIELEKKINTLKENQEKEIMDWQDEYMENPDYPYESLGKGINKIMDKYDQYINKFEREKKFIEALIYVKAKVNKPSRSK